MKQSSHVVGATVPKVGTVLAKKYTILEHLGEGDSGHLYVAEQTTLRKKVAIKVLDPARSADEAFAARVLREARILSLIRHDNIVRLIDYGTTSDGLVYLVSELLEGEDLSRQRPLRIAWPRTKALILQVAAGLREAAKKGVLHGGVRPSNCLMISRADGSDHLKLIGFGLSPADRIDEQSGDELLEVALFMAPEQALKESIDARADVYSIGVLLYWLLTGSAPFTGTRPQQVATLHKMATTPPPRNIAPDAEISAAVEALILRCLAKKREDRYADVAALDTAIREIDDKGEQKRKPGAAAAMRGPSVSIGAGPTQDSALFYSIESLQAMLQGASDPQEQLGILDKMERALVALAGDAPTSPDAERWKEWIRQARDYAWFTLGERHLAADRTRELVTVYQKRLELATSDEARGALLSALASVYHNSLLNYDKAMETYRAALELQPGNMELHLGLAKVLERVGEHDDAIPHYERFIEINTDPKRGAEELARLANLLHHKLSDTDQAVIRLFQATELDAGNMAALHLLAEIFRARHEWLELAQVLESIVEFTASNYERGECAAEAGFVWLEKIEARERAIPMFAKAVEVDPENARVCTVLARIYYENKNFVAAAPIFDTMVRKLDSLGLRPSSQVGVLVRAALVARGIGNTQKAQKLFKRALDMDPENNLALQGAADLAMVRGAWDEARAGYEKLLPSRKGDQAAPIHVKLAEVATALDRGDLAISELKKAIAADPKHRPALEALITAQTGAKDWQGLLKTRQAMLSILKDDEKADAFVEIGKLFRERLNDPVRAVAAYQRAHELRPRDLSILHVLLDLHTAAKSWKEVLPVLDQLVVQETDQGRRARYHYTAAVIHRDELREPESALERFDLVLRDDPSFLKAFQAIDTLLTQRRDWKALERAYRKMINRLPQDTSPLRCLLWQNLAEIYRSRLGDYASAAKSLEVAISIDPANFQRQVMLAELFTLLAKKDPANYNDRLIRALNGLVRLDPSYYASYHQLFSIYAELGEVDKAYCVARTLLFLKQATADQADFYSAAPPSVFRRIRARLTEEVLRRCILPGDQSQLVTNILGLSMPALAAWRSRPAPPSLRGSDPIDTSESPSLPAQLLAYVCSVMGYPQPELHFQPGEAGELTLLSVRRQGGVGPLMIAQAGLLRDREEGEVAFVVARAVLELYAPHHAFFLLERSPENLKQVLVACSLLTDRSAGEFVQVAQGVAAAATELQSRVPPQALEQIKSYARQLGQTDVKVWARAAAIAGYRLGFLLCNDLAAAAHAISQEVRAGSTNITGKDALKELIIYSVSEAYFEARRALGLALG
ncbi:MAG: protein kinase [Nannocystaceae bacterium]